MLPFDIQLEVIKRLPVKTLIRFMSVCKAWKSFINCSEFVAGYRALPTQRHNLLIHNKVRFKEESEVIYVCFVDDDDTFPQQQLTFPPILQLPNKSTIIDSSQGLLCLYAFSQEPHNSMVVLWNPSIRKSIVVAVPNRLRDPFEYVIGFGVCTDTMDPKLVKITDIDDDDDWLEVGTIIPRQVEVFTLSSGEWKISRGNLPRIPISFTWFQAAVGQFIYWLAYDDSNVEDDYNLIMSFDLRTEEFREINLPDSLTQYSYEYLFIYRLKESLSVVDYVTTDSPHKRVCHVWTMDHSNAFTKAFTIDVPNMSVSRILGFTKSGKPIVETQDDIKDLDSKRAFVVYEPCLEHIKDLGIRGDEDLFYGSSYTESLLLLDHDGDHIVRCGLVKK